MSCSWDGAKWTLGSEGGATYWLKPKGTWAVGLKPTKAAITFTGGDDDRCRLIISSAEAFLVLADPYASGEEVELDWLDPPSTIIAKIRMSKVGGNAHPYPQFEISNIEFLHDPIGE